MQQIIYFFQRFKYFLFYMLLALISFAFTFTNLNFHKSKFINSSNAISGGIYTQTSNISEYFSLKSENKRLSEENTRLKNFIEKNQLRTSKDFTVIDTLKFYQKYTYSNAKIIKNDYTKAFNFLTINRGKKDGIEKEMAVVNSLGIIGITDNTTNSYTTVQSILNKNSKINARLKGKTNYFGTLEWDGKDHNTVQLYDIPRQAPIKVGDTIETGGKSTIFPEGILIGTVSSIYEGNTANHKVDITLFNDMSNLYYVSVIKNLDKEEIKSLENTEDE